MSEIIEKSQQVLQELEEKIRGNRLKKIKSEIVPLTYSPSGKKMPPTPGFQPFLATIQPFLLKTRLF